MAEDAPEQTDRDTTRLEALAKREEILQCRIRDYRNALIEMAETAASREGPRFDPEHVLVFSGLLREAVEKIDDDYFGTVVEEVIHERRDDAGMEN